MKIAVYMGGWSDERDVSLASGAQVARALREAGHEVVAIDPVEGRLDAASERHLFESGVRASPSGPPPDVGAADALGAGPVVRLDPEGGFDVHFLALHGGSGEDGTIQSILDLAGVVYTGSDRLGCSIAMDKEVTKRLLRDAGIPTPEWESYDPRLPGAGPPTVDYIEATLGLPVIVKASGGGSSLRLVLAHDRAELAEVIDVSREWDDVVLFERYQAGREFTVGIVGDEIFPVGEIVPEHELFDYECKYQPGKAAEIFPADIPGELSDRLQALALDVHRVLRLRDFSRIDFIVDEGGRAWCLEANTLPGMTANSLLPKAAAAAGIDFPALCDRIARLAYARRTGHST
ncbi:MAG: D-alanine--D-alanine ligase [Gemmatimonadota bacterium]|nr:D-alanine--D-alanine ligase [Gemmatimonadota bacterium]